MPKAAFNMGAVQKQVTLNKMATELFSALRETR
jgi:chemotaxis response regulator CheB